MIIFLSSGFLGSNTFLNIKCLTLLGFISFHVPLFHPWATLLQALRQGKYIACYKHSWSYTLRTASTWLHASTFPAVQGHTSTLSYVSHHKSFVMDIPVLNFTKKCHGLVNGAFSNMNYINKSTHPKWVGPLIFVFSNIFNIHCLYS